MARKMFAAVLLACCLGSVPVHSLAEQQKTWTVNFRGADLHGFIAQVSEMTGKSFVVDPRVRTRDVTVISNQQLTSNEVYELFLSVLQVHGYAAVPAGDVIKIVSNTTAKQSSVPLRQGRVQGEELITRVVAIQNSPVDELVPVLRPLVPQYGHLAAVSSANALIITDHAENIQRIEHVINLIDNADSKEVEVIPVEHGYVSELTGMLESLLPEKGGRRKDAAATVTVVADERNNRLIVSADRETRARIRALVKDLDVPQTQTDGVQVIRLSYADAKSLAEILKEFVSGAAAPKAAAGATAAASTPARSMIFADESLNALVVRAEPSLMSEIRNVIRQLDVRRAQILIEAAIIEVGMDNGLNLGFQWAAGDTEKGVGGVNFSNFGLSLNDIITGISTGQPSRGLGDGVTVGGGELDANGNLKWGGLMQALASNTEVNLLSTPSVMTLDNQEASIIVGQNVPFVTGTNTITGSGTANPFTTIQREDVGVTLKVTPHLTGENIVRLVLEQEASSVQNTNSNINAQDIITSKRAIKTTVLAENGDTIVLGGLIRDDIERTVRRVPLLGSIPLLGALFRSTSNKQVKNNLMVFMRTTILHDGSQITGLSESRYGGILALHYKRDKDGNLKRTVRHPLPTQLDEVFAGRSPETLAEEKAEPAPVEATVTDEDISSEASN